MASHRRAGDAARALVWLGPREIEDALAAVVYRLSGNDMTELAAAHAIMQAWMAELVSALVADGLASFQLLAPWRLAALKNRGLAAPAGRGAASRWTRMRDG